MISKTDIKTPIRDQCALLLLLLLVVAVKVVEGVGVRNQ